MEQTQLNDPWIIRVSPDMASPSLDDNTADVDRLVKAVKKELGTEAIAVPYALAKRMTRILRGVDYRVSATLFEDRGVWHLVDVSGAAETDGPFGLGMDLGSSTLVLRLLDLKTGNRLDEISTHNPQIDVGPDILTRIHHAAGEGGLEELQRMLIERINQIIGRMIKRRGIPENAVAGMSVAGNTTMTHLFMGLDPYWLCREPYIPVVNAPDLMSAADLGLALHPEAPVFIFPNVGSYFGGDLIAGILASGMCREKTTAILVDVGTNAEVVIGNRDWLMACAGAAGPALEGGVAGMGMMAGPGVIDRVVIDPETLRFEIGTIDDLPPVGICGSGLIDLVAQLFLSGMIDLRGKYVPSRCGDRLEKTGGVTHLVLVPARDSGTRRPLTLSQPDIDALMRSKAAMYTILTTIAGAVNIPLNDLERFYVAGTFGSYINPRSAITIGMIPDLPLETYVPLGNSSLEGACRALLSRGDRREISGIRDRITYMELNVNQEFMNLFSAARFIPHTDRSLFPSVKEWRG